MAVIRIDNEMDFQRHVLNCKQKAVLLNFWAWWSEPCTTMATTMARLRPLVKERYSLARADWDRQKWLVERLHIYGVPTLLVFTKGEIRARISGVVSAGELLELLIHRQTGMAGADSLRP